MQPPPTLPDDDDTMIILPCRLVSVSKLSHLLRIRTSERKSVKYIRYGTVIYEQLVVSGEVAAACGARGGYKKK